MRIDGIYLAAVTLLAAVDCGGPGDDEAARDGDLFSRAQPITHGVVSSQDLGVVAVLAEGTINCTGSLIAPRLVLTAAHCLHRSLAVRFDEQAGGAGESFEVVAQLPHPGFRELEFRNDVALLVLGTASDRPLVPLATSGGLLSVGAVVRVVGFGGASGGDREPPLKRTGSASVRKVTEDGIELVEDPSQPCRGDSGGPVLAGPSEALVAVVASGDARCASYATATRIDAVHDFLAGAMAAMEGCRERGGCLPDAHGDAGPTTLPAGCSYHPVRSRPPMVIGLLVVLLAARWFRYTRRR